MVDGPAVNLTALYGMDGGCVWMAGVVCGWVGGLFEPVRSLYVTFSPGCALCRSIAEQWQLRLRWQQQRTPVTLHLLTVILQSAHLSRLQAHFVLDIQGIQASSRVLCACL